MRHRTRPRRSGMRRQNQVRKALSNLTFEGTETMSNARRAYRSGAPDWRAYPQSVGRVNSRARPTDGICLLRPHGCLFMATNGLARRNGPILVRSEPPAPASAGPKPRPMRFDDGVA
jgi:hypothetical protein